MPADPLSTFDERLQSFKNPVVVNGKKIKWRFVAIPGEQLAKLNFYFDPQSDPNGTTQSDVICCALCNRLTRNLSQLKAKKRNVIETLANVLWEHWIQSENECLLSYIRCILLRAGNVPEAPCRIDWAADPVLADPIQLRERITNCTLSVYRVTRGIDLSEKDWISLGNAALTKVDESYFKTLLTGNSSNRRGPARKFLDLAKHPNAYYCFFCNSVVNVDLSIQDPIVEHYSTNSKCYFIEKLLQHDELVKKKIESLKPHHHGIDDSSKEKEPFHNKPQISQPKKRKLQRSPTQGISGDEFDSSNMSFTASPPRKQLVINFKEHVYRKKDSIKKRNVILDDSKDDFSFSIGGHSAFEIPSQSSPVKFVEVSEGSINQDNNKEQNIDNKVEEQLSPSKETKADNEILKRLSRSVSSDSDSQSNDQIIDDSKNVELKVLNDLNIEACFSSDESDGVKTSNSTAYSTPIPSPKHSSSLQSSQRLSRLRHL